MSGGGRTTNQHRRRGKVLPAWASLTVALSLLIQLLFMPYHQALSAPLSAGSDTTRIAAELKAIFGDAASLCVNTDDKGSPAAPAGHCNDDCPFCRFAASAASLVVPDLPLMPFRVDVFASRIEPAREIQSPPVRFHNRQRARAPPALV